MLHNNLFISSSLLQLQSHLPCWAWFIFIIKLQITYGLLLNLYWDVQVVFSISVSVASFLQGAVKMYRDKNAVFGNDVWKLLCIFMIFIWETSFHHYVLSLHPVYIRLLIINTANDISCLKNDISCLLVCLLVSCCLYFTLRLLCFKFIVHVFGFNLHQRNDHTVSSL